MIRRLALILVALLMLGGLLVLLRPNLPGSGPQARTIAVTITGGSMRPAEITVGQGDQVTLRVTTDRPTKFHLHGYDLEQELQPGGTWSPSFEAKLAGRFKIEDEQTERELGVLVVQPSSGG